MLRMSTSDGKIHYVLHTGNKDLIKPADIGAVNRSGDTMTGDLTVKKPLAPALHLVEENGPGVAMQIWNNTLLITNKNSSDDVNNYRLISIANANVENDVARAVGISDVSNGVARYYTILHSGNLHLFGLGAAPASVE